MTDPLFQTDQASYGDRYADHLFAQYKMFVGSTERTSDRRMGAHKHFASLNAALLTLLGLTLQFGSYESRMLVRLGIGLAGLGAAVVYWMLIRSYKNLNTAKFGIIHRIEQRLPLSLYATEWADLGRGEQKWKYMPFSHLELWIPVALAAGYGYLVYWCLKWFLT